MEQEEERLRALLERDGQGHLFAAGEGGWSDGDDARAQRAAFFAQVAALDAGYPGGLRAYAANARRLLGAARIGVVPALQGLAAQPPPPGAGTRVRYDDAGAASAAAAAALEEAGMREWRRCAFVLVAGGIGERLGYGGIKVALSAESLTSECHLSRYLSAIADVDAAASASAADSSGGGPGAELAIMTSEDTHSRTLALLERLQWGGLGRGRVSLVMQGRVACVGDDSARFVRLRGDPYELETKPHGHGDVHALLHTSGLLDRWAARGIRWVVLFQDTNALFFRTAPAIVGVSATRNLDVNFTCVPRAPGEAIGGLARLVDATSGKVAVPLCNVEYNQLPTLLPGGREEAAEDGFSPFPGNINELVFKLESYKRTLARTGGLTPEFVNPKYVPGSNRTKLAASARLECMMQDYALALTTPEDAEARLGFTLFDPWVAFSPAKNSLAQGRLNFERGIPPATTATTEMDIYRANCQEMLLAGAKIERGPTLTFSGVPHEGWPLVVYPRSWAPTTAILSRHIGNVTITARSALVLRGDCSGVVLKNLELDGALVINVRAPGARIVIDGLKVRNASWALRELSEEELKTAPEEVRIRGFELVSKEQRELTFDRHSGETITISQ